MIFDLAGWGNDPPASSGRFATASAATIRTRAAPKGRCLPSIRNTGQQMTRRITERTNISMRLRSMMLPSMFCSLAARSSTPARLPAAKPCFSTTPRVTVSTAMARTAPASIPSGRPTSPRRACIFMAQTALRSSNRLQRGGMASCRHSTTSGSLKKSRGCRSTYSRARKWAPCGRTPPSPRRPATPTPTTRRQCHAARRDSRVAWGVHPGFLKRPTVSREAKVRLTVDRQLYDRLQYHILQQITDAVRGHLRLLLSGRVPADLNAVTADIVFSVAAIIDGGADLEDRETPVIPVLAFATTETRNELVFPELGYGSWMHEYAHGAAEE